MALYYEDVFGNDVTCNVAQLQFKALLTGRQAGADRGGKEPYLFPGVFLADEIGEGDPLPSSERDRSIICNIHSVE
jgi:hypothetical protein